MNAVLDPEIDKLAAFSRVFPTPNQELALAPMREHHKEEAAREKERARREKLVREGELAGVRIGIGHLLPPFALLSVGRCCRTMSRRLTPPAVIVPIGP